MNKQYQIRYKRIAKGGSTGNLSFWHDQLVDEIRTRGLSNCEFIPHCNSTKLTADEMFSLWREVDAATRRL